MRHGRLTIAAAALIPSLGCGGDGERASRSRELVVFNAGSLARPLRAALDTFALATGVTVLQESAGSLETARKLTELGKIPDVIALADEEVFPAVLMPEHLAWYARFGRNRMVIAYTVRSRGAERINPDNWWRVLAGDGVDVARADPSLDPNGYRTLFVLQLAERHYGRPGLAARLVKRWGTRYIRPKEADLVALLQTGEVDYIWSYESMALAAGLEYLTLPAAIDLGSASDSALYATASVRIAGRSRADSVTFRGTPIVYAASIPRRAAHPREAEAFLAFLLSDDGRRVLRGARFDAFEMPSFAGSGVPDTVRKAAGAAAADSGR